ncbi:hypothetical protein ACQ4LE_000749 [Meloidogyne hapla]
MNSDPAKNKVIYDNYNNSGFSFDLFFPALCYIIISLVGMTFNSSVCYITLKYRKRYAAIKSKSAILIALNSFFEILHQSGHFLFFVVISSGKNFIPYRVAIIFCMHSVVGFYSILFMYGSLAFDRLLGVMFPIFYYNTKQRNYIILHIAALIICNIFILYKIIKSIITYPECPVTGLFNDIIAVITYDQPISLLIPYIIVLPVVIIYLIIGVLVRFKSDLGNETMKKLYRSIFIIIFTNFAGYLIGPFLNLLIFPHFNLKPITYWFIFLYIPMLLNISSASNGPILFVNSEDYRNAYLEEFKKIKLIFLKERTSNIIRASPNQIIMVAPKNNFNTQLPLS